MLKGIVTVGELTTSITTTSRVSFEESEAVVGRLKEGDENAFTEVFHLYKDLVYNLCCHVLRDRSEAMDVSQEVFLTLFRKIHQFRGECSLKTWLYRIALNQAANRNRWWRRRFRDRTISLNLRNDANGQPAVDPATEEIQPDQHVLSREMAKALQKSLAQLPFDQRVAVVLRDVDGLNYEQIAEIQGVNVGTVKSRIARGRERLREQLKPFWTRGDE